ncbi:MAG: Putative dTDP-4-dehydrorhamnose reductase [Anaerolineaceae bacterium 46_22]|nr:MAG: Putative dTDP-4-dehydrorhamnose reductase [Anaerolineaceae bacterium 46_22]
MRLLVTGASGLFGLNLGLLAHHLGYDVVGLVHSHQLQGVPFKIEAVDFLETENALATIKGLQPDAIIHCAAIANLHQAEKFPDLAQKLNADVPGELAEAAFEWSVPFLHISTDAIYDGKKGAYVETDPPNPLSVYARSKLSGEHRVQEANPNALIARVVFYGWSLSGNRSLSEFFYNNLKDQIPHKGFIDTFFSPLYVEDLAEILLEMLVKNLKGVYHVVSPEHLSKYEFGVRIAEKFGFDPNLVQPIKMSEMKREAPRSLKLILDPGKVQKDLGHPLPSVDTGIDRLYQRWKEGYHLKLQSFSC